jgi:hypothetical protein
MRFNSRSDRRSASAAAAAGPAALAAGALLAGCLAAMAGCSARQPGLAGQWRLSWEGRIGTEQATLLLQPAGRLLNGSLRTPRGSAVLAGSLDGSRLSFTVDFPGPPAYRIRFSGVAQGDQIQGEAQPQDAGGRAFAGHGGEVARDYYRWSAVRTLTVR